METARQDPRGIQFVRSRGLWLPLHRRFNSCASSQLNTARDGIEIAFATAAPSGTWRLAAALRRDVRRVDEHRVDLRTCEKRGSE